MASKRQRNHCPPSRLGVLGRFLALLALGAACVPALDTTREAREDPSVGASVYREMCQRIAVAEDPTLVSGHPTCTQNLPPSADDSPRLQALFDQRTRLIGETNTALSSPVGGRVSDMLEQMLPLYDDGTMQRGTDAMIPWLAALEQDTDALSALERIAKREGYIQPNLTPGFMRVMMSFDGTGKLLAKGLGPVTTTPAGTTALANALSVVGPELTDSFNEPDDPTHTWFLVRAFLMTRDPGLDEGSARFIVQRNTQGQAVFVGAGGTGTPFPVTRTPSGGGQVTLSEPRDAYGRLLDGSGNLVYRYTNVEGTVLAGLVREAARIAKTSPGAMGQLLRPLPLLMGPNRARTSTYSTGQVRYGGYDTSRSPLLDLAYAAGVVAKKDTLAPALLALQQLAERDEASLASSTHAIAVALQMLRQKPYSDLSLENDTAMTEELLDVLAEVLREPGLAESLLDAVENPKVQALGPTMMRFMTYKDLIDYNPRDINAPPTGSMQTPVDRSQPDLRDNRSIFQRFVHLMHDARHAVLCNKEDAHITMAGVEYPFFGGYARCELNQVDDVAIFHTLSVIGKAQVVLKDPMLAAVATSSLIEYQSGITGFGLSPTAPANARFTFAPFNAYLAGIYDPVPTFDNVPLKSRHNGTIFAWELENFYDHIAPVIQAFYDHGRVDLFVDIFLTLHRHYGSRASDFTQSIDPSAPLYAPNTGIVRFEPVIIEAMKTNPIAGIGQALATLRTINVGGIDGRARLLALARALMLPEQSPGLLTRMGRSYTVRNDGEIVDNISPVLLLVDALRDVDAVLGTDDDLSAAMGDGLKGLVAGLLDSNGTKLASSDTAPLTAQILGFVQARLQAHIAAGDLAVWADGLDDRLQEVLDQPLVQTLVPLGSLLASDPDARTQIDAMLVHLADHDKSTNAYTSTLQGLADAMQLLDDETDLRPLARSLVTAADPKSGLFVRGMAMMQAMGSRDTASALPQLLTRLVTHPTNQNDETPLEGMFDIMLDVNRGKPGATTARTKADYAKVLSVVRSFLADRDRGLERLYEIISNR